MPVRRLKELIAAAAVLTNEGLDEDYLESYILVLVSGIESFAQFGTASSYAVLREYSIALRNAIDLRTSDDPMSYLDALVDVYAASTRDVYARRGADWNPLFDPFELDASEGHDIFQPLMHNDLLNLQRFFKERHGS